MRNAGVKPDSVSYNMILSVFSKMNDLERAEAVFDNLRKENLTPTTACYNILPNLYARRGDHAKCKSVV